MTFRLNTQYPLQTKSATGYLIGPLLAVDFRNATVDLFPTSSFAGTVKFYASTQEEAPDFTAAVSATNIYSTMQVVDLGTGSPVDGDTGIVYTGTEGAKEYEYNFNNKKWIAAVVTAYTTGSIGGSILLSSNQ